MYKLDLSAKYQNIIWAINHYIMLGDNLGAGCVFQTDNELVFLVLVNTTNHIDIDDWHKLKSRLQEISNPAFKIDKDKNMKYGVGVFETHTISIKVGAADAFAKALTDKPGQMGWGSPKAAIDRIGYKQP